MSEKEKFNKQKYDNEYIKTHYKEIKIRIKHDLFSEVENYCTKYDKSKQGLFIEAVKNYIGFIEKADD